VAALLLLPGLAYGASFTNGSFESGTNPGATFITLTAPDSTNITGWTVSNSSIDYIGLYWTAADGTRSLDMDGNSPQGAIRQTFDTVANTNNLVRFAMAGNPDGGAAIKNLRVSTDSGSSTDYSFDVTGHTHADMGWQEKIFLFLATGTSTTLTFASLTPLTGACCFGAALDNVRVQAAVPEPTTLLLWGTMAFGIAAAIRWRRHPRQA